MRQAIQSRRVVTRQGIRPATIVFEDEVIVDVSAHGGVADALDYEDLLVLPGLVDTHVHINEPGRTEWEGFRTASRAAAAGGYTCLVDMPLNCIPATTDVGALEAKRRSAAGQSMVDYAFWGGAVRGNAAELKALAAASVSGFKCFMAPSGVAEFEMVDEADLRSAMPIIAATGLPLLAHAEFPAALGDSTGQHWTRYQDYLASRPDDAEARAIALLIGLCRECGCRIHIVHLASAEPLEMLRAARAEGLPITVETCPHYLSLTAEEIPDGATQFKCAPPIRGAATRELLWRALGSGEIDLIATDHSPCPPILKCRESGDFAEAWGGIASLSLALPVVFSAATERGFSIEDVVRWMSIEPAKLSGLQSRKGAMVKGGDADFVIFDPDALVQVTEERLHFRHAVTPYLGLRLRGEVRETWLRGERVYANGRFPGEPRGRECTV